MGTLFSALHIGRNGLMVAQAQLDTAGHNIANINTEGYSRQRVDVTTWQPNYTYYGELGRGPKIAGVERVREEYLDKVYRTQMASLGQVNVQDQFYARLEDIFQEPGNQSFGVRLSAFFEALSEFSSNVEDPSVRESLLSETRAVSNALNETARRIEVVRSNANEEIRNMVPEINALAQRIAETNISIRRIEANGARANDPRDERDRLLDRLSRLVRVTYRERDTGEVEVLLGDEQLVNGDRWRALTTVADDTIDPDRPDLLRVRWADTGQNAQIVGGELRGLLLMRDYVAAEYRDRTDEIARALIEAVNQVHSQGRGLAPLSGTVTGGVRRVDPSLPLDDPANQVPFTVNNGSFTVNVFNAAGNLAETLTIPVTAGTTSALDVAAAINGMTNLSATVDADGRLVVTAAAGFGFSFANDTSGALVSLGMNGLFEGTDAATIGLSAHLAQRLEWISSGYGTDFRLTGDNRAALAMQSLRATTIADAGRQTLEGYYQATVARLGIQARDNAASLQVEQGFAQDFDRRREEVSGVNMDEEVTNLIAYERAFQGSARIISVADRLLEVLVNLGA
ncbi:MAG TPA: flagellar hook-associated protein FlgK [Candidatus Hydrogenedentes bacterium]|nr:flagellar hook-associated protein FlgK [Candidatus Hydrogenedentota bacterium]